MSRKIYLNFIILYSIFSQGIIGTLSENNIKESSHLLIRNKRLLSSRPSEIVSKSINQVPYVVQIQNGNTYCCMGSILMAQVILTAAHCMSEPEPYHVLSGSSYRNQGIRHNVTSYRIHPHYHPPPEVVNDLALLHIHPQIDIVHSPNRPIIMHHGHVPPRTVGQIISWGCILVESNGNRIFPSELQSMNSPVISREECHTFHNGERRPRTITEMEICTWDTVSRNKCCFGDSGAPLVIFNQLAGIMSWNRPLSGPDVFMNLSYPLHRNWILKNLSPNRFDPGSPQRDKESCLKRFWKICTH